MDFMQLASVAGPLAGDPSGVAEYFQDDALGWVIWAATGAAIHIAGWVMLWVLVGRAELNRKQQQRRTISVVLGFVVLTFIWLALIPVEDEGVRNLFLTLFGVGVTGLVTLSSTTLAANFMAGLMLRQVGSFKVGDFIRIEENFGRVSGRGAFHVEIQTEDRDLVTLPNAYLISRPVRVVRESGTMVTCEVSLGYDLAHEVVEECLRRAVESAGLTDPHVLVVDLLDHAVVYRAVGHLEQVESILSARSKLRRCVLGRMRAAGIEVVSPSFMNQRQVEGAVIAAAPTMRVQAAAEEAAENEIEKLVFDKAEDAQRVEEVAAKLGEARAEGKALAGELKGCGDGERESVEKRVARNDRVVRYLERLSERLEGEGEK